MTTHNRRSASNGRSVSPTLMIWLATASSVVIAALFWFFERDLLWLVAVLLPPIWVPVIHQSMADDDQPTVPRWAVATAVLGLAALFVLGVAVYWLV